MKCADNTVNFLDKKNKTQMSICFEKDKMMISVRDEKDYEPKHFSYTYKDFYKLFQGKRA